VLTVVSCGPVLILASQALEPKTIAISDKTIKARMSDLSEL